MKKIIYLFVLVIFMVSSCKKDEEQTSTGNTDAVLVIQNGGVKMAPGSSEGYSATIVDKDGNVTAATNATWSSSDQNIITVSGSTVSAAGVGMATVTATVTYNGATLTATVPVGVALPSVFTVLPGVICYPAGGDPLQMQPVYLGTGTPGTYTYSSSNSSVASVSSTGLITFSSAGECVITVTAPGLDGSPTVEVPVLVVGEVTVPLPVTKVVVTPAIEDIFVNDNLTYTATAYDSDGNVVTGSTVTWAVNYDSVATINSSGVVTGVTPGEVTVKAFVNGIMGTANLKVAPRKVIILSPYLANVPAGETKQFTATTYNVTKPGSTYVLTATSNPADLTWEVPVTGISIFDFATVNSSGLVSVNSNAMIGMITVVGAYSASDHTIEPGIGVIMVSNCNCGAGTGITNITTTQSSYTLSFMSPMPQTISYSTTPSGGTVTFCSDNESVVSVSSSGVISPMSPGTATIKLCDGNVSKTVTVTVQ